MVALSGAMEMCGNEMEKWRRHVKYAEDSLRRCLLVPSSDKKQVDHMKRRMRMHDSINSFSFNDGDITTYIDKY